MGSFSIGQGETDDNIIATVDVEVTWTRKDNVSGTYINVGVKWIDIDIAVIWIDTDAEVTGISPSAVPSELRSTEVLEDVLGLSLVDC